MTPQDEGPLPEGWASAPIRDLVEVHYGKGLREDKRQAGSVRVYGSNGVVGNHDVALTDGPTVIIGRKGSIGEVHFSPCGCWPIDTTYYAHEFHGIDPNFFASAARLLGLSALDTSTAIPGLNRDDIYAQLMFLPPLAEQQRLVTQVENCFDKVNSVRRNLSRIQTILNRLRQAVLTSACSGRLTAEWREMVDAATPVRKVPDDGIWPELPDCWGSLTVEQACSDVVDCPHSTPNWTSTGVVCLRTTSFKPGVLDLSEVRFVSESTYRQRVSRLEPKAGDVLYSREGGILGIACMIPSNVRLCLGQRMMLMRTNPRLCNPAFLMHVLSSPTILAHVRDLTGGSSSPHLNVGEIKGFPIPLPPLEEQREIVNRVAALFSLIGGIEKQAAAVSRLADKLTKSILAKAFRGELVLTEAELARREGREYEPASVLLERIRAERANHAQTSPSPKRRVRKSNAHV